MYEKEIKNTILKDYKKGKSIQNISKNMIFPGPPFLIGFKKKTIKDLEKIIYIYQNVHCHKYSSITDKQIAIKKFLGNNQYF